MTFPSKKVNGLKNQCGDQAIEKALGEQGLWNRTMENQNFTVFGLMNDTLDTPDKQVLTFTLPIRDRSNPDITRAMIGIQYRITDLKKLVDHVSLTITHLYSFLIKAFRPFTSSLTPRLSRCQGRIISQAKKRPPMKMKK
jgi:hypothetical protein